MEKNNPILWEHEIAQLYRNFTESWPVSFRGAKAPREDGGVGAAPVRKGYGCKDWGHRSKGCRAVTPYLPALLVFTNLQELFTGRQGRMSLIRKSLFRFCRIPIILSHFRVKCLRDKEIHDEGLVHLHIWLWDFYYNLVHLPLALILWLPGFSMECEITHQRMVGCFEHQRYIHIYVILYYNI